MAFMRFALLILLVVAIELAIFRHVHRDLLYLHQPATQIASGSRERLREYGVRALSRRTLSRRHLETLALAAWQAGDSELRSGALARLARDYPDDQGIQLRWAESLRLAGRLDEARAIYRGVLEGEARRAPLR
jgi:hypothetical protein